DAAGRRTTLIVGAGLTATSLTGAGAG
ncbi:MAG: hypothetical protein QOG77_2505, partial [Solirubrobacteraceae bacterium]|nr:hypothetical protein [Solirubrobacteraceae bacterium]